MKALCVLLGMSVSLLALVGCEMNAATGENQFMALSREDEIAMGVSGKEEMMKEMGGEVKSAELRAYVTSIGGALAATTEGSNPTLPWEFTLLDSDVINAFALPGGKVFMSRGLAEKMTNEAQLAAVLGHEVGHVTARHANDRYARIMGAQLGLGVAGAVLDDGSGTVQSLGEQVVGVALMSYDRDQESQSDSLGMRYMTRLNYDPRGMVQVMEILKSATGEGGSQPEWLSTHPLPQTRIERIEREIQMNYAATQNNPQYQLKEREFKDRFLRRLSALPPAEHPARRGVYAFSGHNPADDALMWCAVCRERSNAAKP